MKRILLLLLTTIYIPILIHQSDHNPRKGVALAYGWRNGPEGAEYLRTGTYKLWWPVYPPPYKNATMLPTFWSDCGPYLVQCEEKDSIWPDYRAFVAARKSPRDYVTTDDGRFVVNFFNECDLPAPQCAKPPSYMAEIYLDMIAACEDCAFYGPAVSSKDTNCNWPEEQSMPFHAEIRHHGHWCYWQEFWIQVALAGARRGLDGDKIAEGGKRNCSIHHYAGHPTIGDPGDERDTVASIKAMGCESIIVSEYSSCDEEEMERLTNSFANDDAILAFYVWAPNLPDTWNGTPCEVLLDWETGELTPLGEVFARSGN